MRVSRAILGAAEDGPGSGRVLGASERGASARARMDFRWGGGETFFGTGGQARQHRFLVEGRGVFGALQVGTRFAAGLPFGAVEQLLFFRTGGVEHRLY